MLIKFIATNVKPTAQDVINAWEGESQAIRAIIDTDVLYYHTNDLRTKEGLELSDAIQDALTEEGPVFILNKSLKVAEEMCALLHEELAFDLSCLVESYMETGKLGIKVARDVFTYVEAQATHVQGELVETAAVSRDVEDTLDDEQINAMMASSGLTKGMRFSIGGVLAVIKRFQATEVGVDVIIVSNGKEAQVSATDVLAMVAENKLEEETHMAGSTVKLGAQAFKQEEEATMVTTTNEATTTTKEEVTMTTNTTEVSNEQVIATSAAAQAFLNNTTPVTPVQEEVAAPVATVGAVNVMINQQPIEGENTMTNNTTLQVPVVGTQAPVTAPTTPAVPTVGASVGIRGGAGMVSGTVAPGATQTISALTKTSKRFMSSPEASQTTGATQRIAMTPWYLEEKYAGVVKGEEIMNHIVEVTLPNGGKEVRLRNQDLGIDLVALDIAEMYAAGRMKFLPSDYQLIVELKMANDSVVIPFQIGIYGPGFNRYENDVLYGRKVKQTPIFANNIKRNEFKGRWTSELMLSTKNEKQHIVKCSCGSKNTFFPESFTQVKQGDKVIQTVGKQICWNEKCKQELTVAEVAQDAKGNALEMTSMGYTQRRLPFGFQFGEEVLAQVMAFAHMVLEDSFTLPTNK